MRFLLLVLGVLFSTAAASETGYSWDGTVYGYVTRQTPRPDSALNPGNLIAHLPHNGSTLEGRFRFKAENDTLRLTLRPIVRTQDNSQHEAYLSQWQVRLHASEAWNISVGREVLNWGPAQFRSPASPFYFDNGRNDPTRELSGLDALKLSWTPDMQSTLTLAHVGSSGHVAQDRWRDTWLLKGDLRGEDWAGGLALAHTPGQAAFIGAHGQFTASDALLLYAEAASSSRANLLLSPADPALPFSIAPRSPRRATWLTGVAYTLDDGQSLNAEYLHDGHGYHATEENAYFTRAAISPLLAMQALGDAPPLLGRDYLHLVWQSNPMDRDSYWRAMATHSLSDGGNEFSGYGEYVLTGQLTIYLLGVLPVGNVQQEFSSLLRQSVTAGLKLALP